MHLNLKRKTKLKGVFQKYRTFAIKNLLLILQHLNTVLHRSSSSFNVTFSIIRRTACARVQFSGCSSTTNAHSETGPMAVCCQNLPLGAFSSRSALSMLVGALFKKFHLF